VASLRLQRPARLHLSAAAIATLALLSSTVMTVVAGPAAATSVKDRIASAQQRLDALDARAEAATERYNAARIRLATAQQHAASAKRALAQSQSSLADLQSSVSAFASAAYQGQTLDPTIGMTASSPEAYLDQISTMQGVAISQQGAIADLAAAQHAEAQAQANATAALAAQRAQTQQMQSERDQILSTARQEQQLLGQLKQREQQIIAAAKARAARLAAEQAAAALAARQAAAAAAAAALAAQPAVPAVTHTVVPSGSGGAATAVRWAYAELGKPYVWGAAGPDSFDCSGLTQYVWGKAGVYLDHYTGSQWNEGLHVSRDQLEPGDLVFFYSDLHHVGIYVGNNQFIEAPHTGANVMVASLTGYYSDNYAGAVRPGV
jgi:cell wall-associated NlpC family hydrolase